MSLSQGIQAEGRTEGKDEQRRPLEIIIIGAGIAGLSLGIYLRQNGHRVREVREERAFLVSMMQTRAKTFEQSKFARELGAAVHIPPNAHGLVKRMGINPAEAGANEVEHLAEYMAGGELVRNIDLRASSGIWQHKWMMAHRVRLHEALKERALATTDPGIPCELRLSTTVADVHPELGGITLQDGQFVSGDVVIGVDGVHSRSRRRVPGGENARPFSSGKNAFRFLLKREDALHDPITRDLCEKPNTFSLIIGSDRRIIMYPTNNNQLLNVVCIHPEEESNGGEGWTTDASKESLLHVYQSFPPAVIALLAKAESNSLKVWRLLDMEDLPTWVNGCFALIGDAAHPFLPHQGQGAAVAIEDAAALGVLLERGLRKEEAPDCLKLYQRIRYKRACAIQDCTRRTGMDVPDQRLDTNAYWLFNFGHDEIDNSTQMLREWKYSHMSNPLWMMPIAFGPVARCSTASMSRSRPTFAMATIKFETSRTLIQNLLPPSVEKFGFGNPGTVSVCSLVYTALKGGSERLSTGEHGTLSLYIHDVKYTAANGSTTSGTYIPVIFDNFADAVMGDREALGLPKVYTTIVGEHNAEQYHIQAESQGVTWAIITLHNLGQSPPLEHSESQRALLPSSEDSGPFIAWRTMPTIERRTAVQQTPRSEAVAVSTVIDGDEEISVECEWTTTDVAVNFSPWDWQTLPTLHETVRRLAEIPIFRFLEAKVLSGAGHLNFRASTRLE